MNTTSQRLGAVAVFALIAATGLAYAAPADQPAGGPPAAAPDGPGWGYGPGMMGGRGPMMGRGMMGGGWGGPGMGIDGSGGGLFTWTIDPARVQSLKTALAIRPDQEAAWNGYIKALQDMAATVQSLRQGMNPATIGGMAPADRQDFMIQARTQRQEAGLKVAAAANTLVSSLDARQKARYWQELGNWGGGCPGMGRGW
jgi:hypothetical protein